MKAKKYILVSCLTFLFLFGSQTNCLSQENQENNKKKFPLIFNEFTGALNWPFQIFNGRLGFGAGIYRSFFDKSWANLVLGIQYDKVSFIQRNANNGGHAIKIAHFDIVTNIHSISFPIVSRLNIGKRFKVFFDIGLLNDIILSGNQTIIYNNGNNNKDNSYLPYIYAFGTAGGLGFKLPLKKNELVVKFLINAGILAFSERGVSFAIFSSTYGPSGSGLLKYWLGFNIGYRILQNKVTEKGRTY
jgi:hypothetical protein